MVAEGVIFGYLLAVQLLGKEFCREFLFYKPKGQK